MIKIATWNVNSVKARLRHLLRWLAEAEPDVVLLQELKTADEAFPGDEVGDLGYNAAVVGQKTYNGVAVLSKRPIDVLATLLPGDGADTQARYLEAFTAGVRVVSLYLPNGNPIGSEKFTYKLAWMERLCRHVETLLESEDVIVLGGDYNVAPDDRDVYEPKAFAGDALCQPETRAAFRKILYLGLTDAIRAFSDGAGPYTWWDYQRRSFAADQGLRIDHLLLSPQAADRLTAADVDRGPRGWDKPSDHAPVWCTLREEK
jgi:exodeoxyribonuclease-3